MKPSQMVLPKKKPSDGFNINDVVLPLFYYTRPDQGGVVGILSIKGFIFCQIGVPACVFVSYLSLGIVRTMGFGFCADYGGWNT